MCIWVGKCNVLLYFIFKTPETPKEGWDYYSILKEFDTHFLPALYEYIPWIENYVGTNYTNSNKKAHMHVMFSREFMIVTFANCLSDPNKIK